MDNDAFINQLYHDYYFSILSYCTAMLAGDEDAAANCAHTTFDEASRYVQKLQSSDNVLAWLRKTAYYRVKRTLRAKGIKVKREVPILDTTDRYELALQYMDDFEDSEIDIEASKEDVLSALTQEERMVYAYKFVDNLTNVEIAQRLNMSISGTRVKILRLQLKIKLLVSQYLGSD